MDVVELRLRSAEDLKDVRRVKVGKLLHPLLAAAWIAPPPAPLRHRLRTLPPDHTSALLQPSSPTAADEEKSGTLFPTWKPTPSSDIRVHVAHARAPSNKVLVIQLYAKRARSALPTRTKYRLVGTVTVPLADIVSDGAHNHWQILSYNVKLPSGQRQGVLNFSACFSQAWVTPSHFRPTSMTSPHYRI